MSKSFRSLHINVLISKWIVTSEKDCFNLNTFPKGDDNL
jgi:hypothetical protein